MAVSVPQLLALVLFPPLKVGQGLESLVGLVLVAKVLVVPLEIPQGALSLVIFL